MHKLRDTIKGLTLQGIETPSPFILDHSLTCGQVFRWRGLDGWWYRALEEGVVKVRQIGNHLGFRGSQGVDWESKLERYFRFDDKLDEIIREIKRDDFISQAVQKYRGLRLVRQDPWECLICYICATNSNIPQIERTLDNLCRAFGQRVVLEDIEFYTFPTAESLASADIVSLKACKVGYRAEFIKSTAQAVLQDASIFRRLSALPYEHAREELLQRFANHKVFKGIGPKVADCILLFSLDKMESFPIDVWMLKTILKKYYYLFEQEFIQRLNLRKPLGKSGYFVISHMMREYFGKFAGYAQEYLYHHVRTS